MCLEMPHTYFRVPTGVLFIKGGYDSLNNQVVAAVEIEEGSGVSVTSLQSHYYSFSSFIN